MSIKFNKGDLVDHIAVGGMIFNKKGELLVMKHNKFRTTSIPMGKAEVGESAYAGIKREMKVELGIDIKTAKEVKVFKIKHHRDGRDVNVDYHLFIITSYDGEVTNNEPNKHEEVFFESVDSLKNIKNKTNFLREALEIVL